MEEQKVKVQQENPTYKFIDNPILLKQQTQEQIKQFKPKSVAKPRAKNKKHSRLKDFNYSIWQHQQNIAYAHFLRDHYDIFLMNSTQKRLIGINVQMSKAVKSRSVDQCRSHHQKMMKYHKTVPNIIAHILGRGNNMRTKMRTCSQGEKIKIEEGRPE